MKKAAVLNRMRELGVVPVIRADSEIQALRFIEAIADGGITVMEVTMTIPNALQLIAKLAKEYTNLLVGAGSVLEPSTAKACISEGAQFVVSPALNEKTVELCNRHDVVVAPGALTPTEIVTAWQCGADVVKVFPVSAVGGVQYLRSIKGPLPQIEMIPTGGVSLATAREFLEAGAFALGVGSELLDIRAEKSGRYDSVVNYAAQLLETVRASRAVQIKKSAVRSS